MSTVETMQQKIAKPASKVTNHRFCLNLGDGCTSACEFCFQKNASRNHQRIHELGFQEAIHCVSLLKNCGVEEIEFTGGEPTLRPDLSRIVAFARKIGIKHIGVATSGVRLSSWPVIHELKNAGVDEFRFLMLGHNAAIHDLHTRVAGSFQHLNQAILNCQRLGMELRVKTVVTGLNYNYLVPLMEKLLQLQVYRINFICLHPSANNTPNHDSLNVLYSFVAPKFQKIADCYWRVMKKITFSFIPFCFMVGYEQYVNNGPQIIHEAAESDFLVENQGHFALWHSALTNPLNFSFLAAYKNAVQSDWQLFCRDDVQKFFELKYRRKSPECLKCRYDLICDGIWRNYIKWVGFREIQAVPGKKIQDPTHFMRASIT
jgi:MoaA/NifB/PqqE/SkfB family radical SAM enzyme